MTAPSMSGDRPSHHAPPGSSGRLPYLQDVPLDEARARFDEALHGAGALSPGPAVSVPLEAAVGRVTASAVWARTSKPPLPRRGHGRHRRCGGDDPRCVAHVAAAPWRGPGRRVGRHRRRHALGHGCRGDAGRPSRGRRRQPGDPRGRRALAARPSAGRGHRGNRAGASRRPHASPRGCRRSRRGRPRVARNPPASTRGGPPHRLGAGAAGSRGRAGADRGLEFAHARGNRTRVGRGRRAAAAATRRLRAPASGGG